MTFLVALLFLIAGFGAGWVHFALLRRSAELLVGGGSLGAGLGLHIGRLALTGATLAAAALFGWLPLLCCAAGVTIARLVTVHRATGSPP
ncbi:MAG: ATP synthase subunit I [Caulobacteraceae bacterium]